jgi:hypothetical protein
MIGKQFRITGNYQLRFFVEVFNLTDHRNILYVYRDTGDPDFTLAGNYSEEYMKDPSNFGPPRSIRIGASFKF